MEESVGRQPALTQASNLDRMPPWPCPPCRHLGIVCPPLLTILDGGTRTIFFLKLPCPPALDKPDVDPNLLVPLKTNCPTYSTLVTTSENFFGCAHILGVFPAPSNGTLKLSPFLHSHFTYFYHFHLMNEDPKHKA
jgi:hypothetical protein